MKRVQRLILRPWAAAVVMLVCFGGIAVLFQYYDYSAKKLMRKNAQAYQLAGGWDRVVSCTKDILISNDLRTAIKQWKHSIMLFDRDLYAFIHSDLTAELSRRDAAFKLKVEDTENLWQVVKPRIEYVQLRFEEYLPADNDTQAKRSLLHELMYQMGSSERSTEYLRLFDLTYDMDYMISSLNEYFRITLNGTVEILSATIDRRSWQLRLVLWISNFFIFTFTLVFIIMSHRALNTTAGQLKFLSNRLMDAEDNERKRWAQELHDEIGQALTGIKYGVDNAVSLLERERIDDGIGALNNLIHVIQNAIDEARRISVSLWPAILDQLGIVATISWYCREYQRIYSGISLQQHIRIKESQISADLKIVIYRVLQESLTNVAKHSSAEHVSVELRKSKGVLRLTITDDGPGFSLHAVERAGMTAQHGFGLISMRERVELSGGEFKIDSAPGRGTTIGAAWKA